MKYTIKNIAYPIEKAMPLKQMVSNKLKINGSRIKSAELVRKAIDARHKNHLKFVYTITSEISGKVPNHPDLIPFAPIVPDCPSPTQLTSKNPVIIGAGPAGLFAAYELVEKGFKPVIYEQGQDILRRTKTVEDFWKVTSKFIEKTNVQFGEGGAGTFSDGKLTARGKNWFVNKVIDILIKFGAPKSIGVNALPHLGTEVIRAVTYKIRKYLEEHGAEFKFEAELKKLEINDKKVSKIWVNDEVIEPEIIILATGNAAIDVFDCLHKANVELENKPFAIGFRIEHSKSFIDKAFYGERTDLNITGAATYRLTFKDKKSKKGVYSFCMCPGGFVISASSKFGHQVVNGMSYSKRDNAFSNSAIVINVDENDYGTDVLSALKWQQKLEQSFFNEDLPFYAPAQTVLGFINNTIDENLPETSYKPGVFKANLYQMLPENLSKTIKKALTSFDIKIPGFAKDGVLMGLESRTSCPVRIVRSKTDLCSVSASNLYPIGEGSGYAGGIVSSAADGLKIASKFFF